MNEKVTFIDQTLDYALANKYLTGADCIYVKQEIAAMAQVVFDLSLDSLMTVFHSGTSDVNDIRVCLQADLGQLAKAHQLGCGKVKISLTHEEVENLPVTVSKVLRQAALWNMTVSLYITGTCKYSAKEIRCLCRLVKEYEINSIVFADEHSQLDPMISYQILLELQQQIPCSIEYYGKNGRGLAAGNALGAIRSGVHHLAVAVGGANGYPAFEEVLMGAWCLLKLPVEVPKNLAARCREILSRIGQHVATTKPIIGTHIFAHESGIHVDGVNKKSDLYEPFTPECVGLSRKIIIGKHSGKAAIELKLKEMNIFVQPTAVLEILEKVRSLAIRQKAAVSDTQLRNLVYEVAS